MSDDDNLFDMLLCDNDSDSYSVIKDNDIATQLESLSLNDADNIRIYSLEDLQQEEFFGSRELQRLVVGGFYRPSSVHCRLASIKVRIEINLSDGDGADGSSEASFTLGDLIERRALDQQWPQQQQQQQQQTLDLTRCVFAALDVDQYDMSACRRPLIFTSSLSTLMQQHVAAVVGTKSPLEQQQQHVAAVDGVLLLRARCVDNETHALVRPRYFATPDVVMALANATPDRLMQGTQRLPLDAKGSTSSNSSNGEPDVVVPSSLAVGTALLALRGGAVPQRQCYVRVRESVARACANAIAAQPLPWQDPLTLRFGLRTIDGSPLHTNNNTERTDEIVRIVATLWYTLAPNYDAPQDKSINGSAVDMSKLVWLSGRVRKCNSETLLERRMK